MEISDIIENVIDPLQKLHQAKFIGVCDGRILDTSKNFYENGIIDKQKILLNGI